MSMLLDASGNRHKGRLPSQMRPLVSERAVLARADGSAKWVQDGTAVLAAVHGPTQAGARKEDAEKAILQVLFKPRNGVPGSQDHEYELMLQQLLEKVVLTSHHPRTVILVVVQVLQADGSVLAVALNAIAAALVDAGIPLKNMFAGVCCAFAADGTLVIDPDDTEEQLAAAVVTAAYPSSYKIKRGPGDTGGSSGSNAGCSGSSDRQLCVPDEALLVMSRGPLQIQQLVVALQTTQRGCEGVSQFVHLALTKSFRDTLVKSGDPAVDV